MWRARRRRARVPGIARRAKGNACMSKPLTAAVLAALLATLGGTVVLAGYVLDVPALIGVLPGWAPMKPNTALCFMLNGFVLALSLLPAAPSGFSAKFAPAHRSGVLALLAVLPILIGLVTLGEYLFVHKSGICRIQNDIVSKVKHFLQCSRRNIKDQTHTGRNSFKVPDMRHRSCKLDVSHTLSTNA